MEFPSRSGGAQGGLIKANLFAQSGMPAYSNTRHGDSVIHTQNGRISITRDKVSEQMPYLMTQLYQDGVIESYRMGVEMNAPQIESGGRSAAEEAADGDRRTGRAVFVGDGYFLDLARNPERTASRPVLISVDDPEADWVDSLSSGNRMGANVAFDVPYLMDAILPGGQVAVFPSVMACGWRDEARRYAFCVFGILDEDDLGGAIYQSRYVCYVGDTGTRTVRRIELPTLPDSPFPLKYYQRGEVYKTSWWGVEMFYDRGYWAGTEGYDSGPARCYCVGPGHLLTLLVPQERLTDIPPDHNGSYTVLPNRLPPGSAPCLLRSRDYGETWTIERAGFLIEDDPIVEEAYSGGTAYLQRVSWASMFVAAPLGDGSVAIAAHGNNPGQFDYDNHDGNFQSSHRAWRFYVSHGGGGFTNTPWPMDQMRGHFPSVKDVAPPVKHNERHYEYPLFDPGARHARAYSFGPGHFAFCTIQKSLVVSSKDWGAYPQDYPVTVWQTLDKGKTWQSHLLPDVCKFYSTQLELLKQAYDINSGTGSLSFVSDSWAMNDFFLGYYEPARPGAGGEPSQLPLLAVVTHDVTGPIWLCASTDPQNPVGSLQPVEQIGHGPGITHPHNPNFVSDVFAGVSKEMIYTGDVRNPMYPELVYPGYPEFEEAP